MDKPVSIASRSHLMGPDSRLSAIQEKVKASRFGKRQSHDIMSSANKRATHILMENK